MECGSAYPQYLGNLVTCKPFPGFLDFKMIKDRIDKSMQILNVFKH